MAVVSDAIFHARTAPAYVSSSAYYGYVPPCTRENQLNSCILECNGVADDSLRGHRVYGDSAMETDDDGYDCSAASCRLNNHYVIPEASSRIRLEAENRQHQQQEQVQDADTLHRRNRKRCNSDLEATRELKKFRGGGGNGRVYYGTRCTKDYGMAKMHYESASLRLSTTHDKIPEQPSNETERCCWAAGNRSLSNADLKYLSSNDASKFRKNDLEYENMLFETHGCSVYHGYSWLHLSQNDHVESEF